MIGTLMKDVRPKQARSSRQFKPLGGEHVRRLESIARVTGAIAHDFNNLLMLVNGYADLLLSRLPADDPRRADAEAIRQAGQRASALTARLLTAGRRAGGRPQVFDLNEFLTLEKAALERELGPGARLELRLERNAGRIRIDRPGFHAALLELARNAHEAMPEGGPVVIETRRLGEYAEIIVQDSGAGIAPEAQPYLFEPFFTTKARGLAKGLGLAIVYGVMAQAGGEIAVSSVSGGGSAVRLRLPLAL
jgi:signal transduction histidine kinase